MAKSTKQPQEKKGIGCFRVALIIILVPIVLLGGFIFFATADLRRSDEDILKAYQPSAEIADIVEKNTLTEKGRAALYRSDPQIVDAETFAKDCRTKARGVEPLACFAPKPGGGPFGGKQIFLLKIDDPRFSDHKYAAAVHEMLHIAYIRLSSDEKKRINSLLEQELKKHQDDLHLMEVVNVLKDRKGDQKDVVDELHSKFGVEYGDLSPELEDYYKQYFNDRIKVVALFKSGGFNSRVRRMDEISYELKTLTPKIKSLESQLTAYQNANDQAGFNSIIGQYNNMVSQYNGLAGESQRIYSEIQEFYKYFNPNYQPPQKSK